MKHILSSGWGGVGGLYNHGQGKGCGMKSDLKLPGVGGCLESKLLILNTPGIFGVITLQGKVGGSQGVGPLPYPPFISFSSDRIKCYNLLQYLILRSLCIDYRHSLTRLSVSMYPD